MSRKEKFFYMWLGATLFRFWRWFEPVADSVVREIKDADKPKDEPHKFITREVLPDGTTSDYCCEKPFTDPIHRPSHRYNQFTPYRDFRTKRWAPDES